MGWRGSRRGARLRGSVALPSVTLPSVTVSMHWLERAARVSIQAAIRQPDVLAQQLRKQVLFHRTNGPIPLGQLGIGAGPRVEHGQVARPLDVERNLPLAKQVR